MECREVELTCPDTNSTFLTTSCCYSTGPVSSNCFLARPADLATQCPLYSCYLYDQVLPPTPPRLQAVGRFGATNGCSVVPNSWLNEEVRSVWRIVGHLAHHTRPV